MLGLSSSSIHEGIRDSLRRSDDIAPTPSCVVRWPRVHPRIMFDCIDHPVRDGSKATMNEPEFGMLTSLRQSVPSISAILLKLVERLSRCPNHLSLPALMEERNRLQYPSRCVFASACLTIERKPSSGWMGHNTGNKGDLALISLENGKTFG